MMKHIKMLGGFLAAVFLAVPCFANEISFKETASFLQSGGDYYLILTGDQIRLQLKAVPEIVKALQEVKNPEMKPAADAAARLVPILMNSGIMKLDGIGQSSFKQGNLYSNRVVFYSKNAKNNGYIWNCIRRENRNLSILDRAPENTIFLSQSRFDLGKLHAYLKSELQMHDKEFFDLLVQFEKSMSEEGVPLPQLYDSLGEEFTLIVSSAPEGGNPMIPFEFAAVIETKSDYLFRLIKDKVQKEQTAQIQDGKILINAGFVIFEISASPKEIVFKTSGFRFADGKQLKSLAGNPVFARYAKGLPGKGIGVFYLAPNCLAPLMNSPFLQGNPAVAAYAKTPGNLMIYTISDNGFAGYGNSDVSLVPNVLSQIPALIRLADSDAPGKTTARPPAKRPAKKRPAKRPAQSPANSPAPKTK